VPIIAVEGNTNQHITNVQIDSRKVALNDLFIAISGEASDGHQFIKNAIDQGALAVVCERLPEQRNNGVTYIQVADARVAAAYIASNFYNNPSKDLKLVGVTGTNGKTTVATLLYELFLTAGFKVGLISTVVIKINDTSYETKLTTPDSLSINSYLASMRDQGVEFVFMEVSSHGIAQQRTLGLHFEIGIFTNLSHDHLDYHKTFSAYRDTKKIFFDQLPKSSIAITNDDDKNGAYMLQNTKAKKVTYALKSHADFQSKILENNFNGLLLKFNQDELWSGLIGSFNAYNLLAVFAASQHLGLDKMESLRLISQLKPVNGRFQQFVSKQQKITAIVDYAHTPDALENVLETINSIRTKNEQLITVVGCGGNRDASKRPIMGEIAASLSTKVIFTSDNPRFEDPSEIIKQMEEGVNPAYSSRVLSIENREQAIKTACSLAQAGDIILIAGKGHENYQEIKGERSSFDDFFMVKKQLTTLNK
jgi:UDP-N-acetylmuramoyl-L-alanyl-D-glutamate--2,6-diaminopimelate ligase